MTLWERLSHIRTLHFSAQSAVSTGWDGEGSGEVEVKINDDKTLIFSESGTWTPRNAPPLLFRNVFRWTNDSHRKVIRLEHLRFGPDNPVYLFDLYQQDQHTWLTLSPHLCNQDVYKAEIHLTQDELLMHWTINGPEKQELLRYSYTG